ncbi:MAG: hypothetical protein N2235_09750 [Fischerella sp.]|nr:hypothetical protein [Fischerella sp.]
MQICWIANGITPSEPKFCYLLIVEAIARLWWEFKHLLTYLS